MKPLRWSLGHGVEVAYSTAADGDQRDPARRSAFAAPLLGARRLVVPRQVHGVVVLDAAAPDLSGADGVVTSQPDLAIGAYGADCPGVVIAAPDALGVAHCGWRGTAGGMVGKLCDALVRCSATHPSTWRALIGPGISGRRYEVDAPVLESREWPATALAPAAVQGRAHLDLATVLHRDLEAAGVGHITQVGVCTADDPRLHSFRHRGAGLVQMLVAWR
jgi:hypothetical protein